MSQFKIPLISPAIIEMQRDAFRIQTSLYPMDGIVKQTREFMKPLELASRLPIPSIPPFTTTSELLAPIRAQIAENQKFMQNLMHQQAIITAKMLSQIDFRPLAMFQNVYEATGVASKHPSETQKQNQETLSTPEFADEFQNEIKTAFELSVEALQASPSDGETSNNTTQEHVGKNIIKNLQDQYATLPPFAKFLITSTGAWEIGRILSFISALIQTGTPVAVHMAIHLLTFLATFTLPM